MFAMATGDAVLCYFANILKGTMQDNGICARLGGDIFASFIEHQEEDTPS